MRTDIIVQIKSVGEIENRMGNTIFLDCVVSGNPEKKVRLLGFPNGISSDRFQEFQLKPGLLVGRELRLDGEVIDEGNKDGLQATQFTLLPSKSG